MKKNTTNAVTISRSANIVSVIMPAPNMERAGRVNYFHHVAEEAGALSVKAAFYVGLELMKAKAEIPHGELTKWIDANCDFTPRTAQNYIHTAYMYLSRKFDVEKLITQSDAIRQEAVEATASDCGTASLNEIYIDLGIVKKSPSNLGGKREGAGRKPKASSQEEMLNAANAIANSAELSSIDVGGAISKLYEASITRGGFGSMKDQDLKSALTSLKDILNKGLEILNSRKA